MAMYDRIGADGSFVQASGGNYGYGLAGIVGGLAIGGLAVASINGAKEAAIVGAAKATETTLATASATNNLINSNQINNNYYTANEFQKIAVANATINTKLDFFNQRLDKIDIAIINGNTPAIVQQ